MPERATIEIDRRCSPNYLPADGYRQLVEYIAANADLGGCRIEHDPPFMDSNGLGDTNNRELAERVAKLAREMGRDGKLVGVPYGTDAAAISAVGVPTIVFGPGAIAQAHTADEFIEIDQLECGAEVVLSDCDGRFESLISGERSSPAIVSPLTLDAQHSTTP